MGMDTTVFSVTLLLANNNDENITTPYEKRP